MDPMTTMTFIALCVLWFGPLAILCWMFKKEPVYSMIAVIILSVMMGGGTMVAMGL